MMTSTVLKISTFGFRLLLIACLVMMSLGAADSDGDIERSKENDAEDGEAILMESVGMGPSGEDQPPMFMDPDPMFTWRNYEPSEENPIFKTGETLKYDVSWMGINAGTITMTLHVDSRFDGRPAYKAVVVGETNKTFSLFFKVHDVITSFMDPDTLNSMHYIKDVREGDYRKLKETKYDLTDRTATVRGTKYPLPPNSKDPIACIYAMRRYAPQEGKTLRMNSNSEGKNNYPVEIEFTTRSTLKLDGDIRRNVIMGKPLPTWEGRVFEKKQSKVLFWVTDDAYVVPIQLETKVRIGTMKAKLIMRKGPGWEVNLEKD